MERERVSQNTFREKLTSIGKTIQRKGLGIKGLIIKQEARLFVGRVEKKIAQEIKPDFPEGFKEAFTKIMQDKNVIPIIVSTHEGHGDGTTTAALSLIFTDWINESRSNDEQFRGFVLPIASSMMTGHQSLLVKHSLEKTLELMPKYHLFLSGYTREKDRSTYGIEDDNQENTNITTAVMTRDTERIADGFAIYPAAGIEAGRMGTDQKRKGMQKFDWQKIHRQIKIMEKRYNRKVLIIHCGSHGAFNITDPSNDNRPTKKALKATFIPFSTEGRNIMSVKVKMPMFYQEIEELLLSNGLDPTAENIGDFIGKTLAQLVPKEARGVY
jgi:hypothetical protein